MVKEKKYITVMRYFFPLIFLFYFGGITLFGHSHVLNGVVIVHSHPYKGEHTHTEKSFETILFLSVIQTFGNVTLFFTPFLCLILFGIFLLPEGCGKPRPVTYGVISPRAPPVNFPIIPC